MREPPRVLGLGPTHLISRLSSTTTSPETGSAPALKLLRLLVLLAFCALLSLCRGLELPPPHRELPVGFFLAFDASPAAGSCGLAVEAGDASSSPF